MGKNKGPKEVDQGAEAATNLVSEDAGGGQMRSDKEPALPDALQLHLSS